MIVDGRPYRTIWLADDRRTVEVIDQRRLPHAFVTLSLTTPVEAAEAIRDMSVRGAPLIGATAAWGIFLAMCLDPSDASLGEACRLLLQTRPTAVNLPWAVEHVRRHLGHVPPVQRAEASRAIATRICDQDVRRNAAIGQHGLALLRSLAERRGHTEPLNILTHCNAGWLATVDWGTALAPIYMAHDQGVPVHVWVDETRPRNQGASLTAWELLQHGVAHTIVVDNAGGHLMQQGRVDCCITGSDRTTAAGDVCNKIGTYLKALAAYDNDVPFYVAVPGPSIDFAIGDAHHEIPIEQRSAEEVTRVSGLADDGSIVSVTVTPPRSPVANWAFDVTPARLVTALITERGVCPPTREDLARLYADEIAAGSSDP